MLKAQTTLAERHERHLGELETKAGASSFRVAGAGPMPAASPIVVWKAR